eukprot:5588255-Prymnesium_polylepis.1
MVALHSRCAGLVGSMRRASDSPEPPTSKRPRPAHDDRADFACAWDTCSAILTRARLLAGNDLPPRHTAPFCVSQLESWARRLLARNEADAAVPSPAALETFCADTIRGLRDHMRARAVKASESVAARLAEAPAPTSPWAALPDAFQQ